MVSQITIEEVNQRYSTLKKFISDNMYRDPRFIPLMEDLHLITVDFPQLTEENAQHCINHIRQKEKQYHKLIIDQLITDDSEDWQGLRIMHDLITALAHVLFGINQLYRRLAWENKENVYGNSN